VVAVNDRPEGYRYPDRVRFEIRDVHVAEYRLAAEFLNHSQVDVACLQHEYGIFGGAYGSHLLELLRGLRMPIVSTLHTVLREPGPEQRSILREIARLSDRLVVMARRAITFLTEIYDVPAEKIVYIPHGIPDVPFMDADYYKDQFGVEGRKVLLTFGLLSPGKGIEYVIRALPEIVRSHPEVVYIILGATHPHVRREQGESYRQQLQTLARELGVEDNVIFHNRFVELDELCEYLGTADIYVTPYLGESQIVSGTLAYALGAGKAVVSTPYWYAEEMLADGRGRIVPFRDPAAIAAQVVDLLDNPVEMTAVRKRAYGFCRSMIWPEVGRAYLKIFDASKKGRLRRPRVLYRRTAESFGESLPELNLDHLFAMCDDTGMLQHAHFAIPDRAHGYCTDDNARALIVALGARTLAADPRLDRVVVATTSFLHHAFNPDAERFRNFMTYDRRWLEEIGSEDSHGRGVWALGVLVRESRRDWEQWLAMSLFRKAMRPLTAFNFPRTQAFALLGLHAYLQRFNGDREAATLLDTLANALHMRFLANATEEWPWVESEVTYDNARIPQALLLAGQWLKRRDMVDTALRALGWLIETQTSAEGHFCPIGNRGWHARNRDIPARFDQQPLEPGSSTEACLSAFDATGDEKWLRAARLCFDWFLGRNDLRAAMADLTTGGCRDGLNPEGANENQGAESTLAWLMAQIAMTRHPPDAVRIPLAEKAEATTLVAIPG
jgi:glycosyltransferase involved in cell wall biosynthesis